MQAYDYNLWSQCGQVDVWFESALDAAKELHNLSLDNPEMTLYITRYDVIDGETDTSNPTRFAALT